MKLSNTLSRKKEEFQPIDPPNVSLYTCGPTVYDFAQVGNLRAFVFNDTLRRALLTNGYQVKHVMNITDVGHLVSDADEGEDKLEKGAAREGKTVWEVAQYYIDAFKRDMELLNNLPPNGYKAEYARATDFIAEQIDIVKRLIEKGYAYITEQAIYFDVTKLSDYGQLARQNLKDKEVGARDEVVTDKDKKNPHDFALWFFTVGRFSGHTMHWPSPWGGGFPGWHLECSAIIHATLGEPIDIHTGGVDHIGTHHTNEIAQTEAAFGKKLANYWLHNEFVMVDGQKMSKSKGNFVTLSSINSKGYDPLALRLLFLQSHYKSQLNFTWESLSAAAENLKVLNSWADLIHQPDTINPLSDPDQGSLVGKIKLALADDLNTARALAVFNGYISKGGPSSGLLTELDKIFGFKFARRQDITEAQKNILIERQRARDTKDWQRSDNLRNELAQRGIEINDTDQGQRWSRLN